VMPVLMPGNFHPVAARLAEDLAAPEDDVGADELLDEVENAGIAGEREEIAAAAYPLAVLALDMDADQALGPHGGIFRDEPVERRAQRVDAFGRQAIARHDDPAIAIALDLVRREPARLRHRFFIS